MKRTGFIGGSDCVKIMNGDWLDLWQVKTGRKESEDLSRNIAVQVGIATESLNIEWFEHEYDCIVQDEQKSFEETIGLVPVKGTVDGVWNNAIIEAKHTNSRNNMEDVLSYYMPQVQTYIRLANAAGAYLSVIFGNNKWESAYVSRNDEYFNSMWSVVSDFWGYVERDQEPLGVDVPSINIDKIEIDNMVKRDASRDNQFVEAAYTFVENEAAAKTFENAKKDLKSMVAGNEREVYCDTLSIKRSKNGALRIVKR